jgi:GntR family transcriptional regulator/MocR family aminotransferase
MHVNGWLADGDDRTLAAAAARAGLVLRPISPLYLREPARPGFLLGYTAFDTRALDRSARRLAELLDQGQRRAAAE